MTPGCKTKVLFFCEAVTLAHVARPAVLSQALDLARYDVHLAQHPRYRSLLGDLPVTYHDLDSITPHAFMEALAQGSPVYEEATLLRYVEEDRALIRALRPDVVVGDFRISLQVSARLEGVPFITLSNAYWSQYVQQNYVVPDLPFARVLGPRLGQGVFSMVRPLAFALHCRPMNAVRRRYGLAPVGTRLQRVYTDADMTLYADASELFDMADLPRSHRFVGPVIWSPAMDTPAWWSSVPKGRPCIYVTLGSSGAASALPRILAALSELPVCALVSTAGATLPADMPDNVFSATYLDGEAAVARSQLVICNGGSPTAQQALVKGVPVIGLASNLDQHLNMSMVSRAGAGLCLRAASVSTRQLCESVKRALDDGAMADRARDVAKTFAQYDAGAAFARAVDDVLQGVNAAVEVQAKEVQGERHASR